MSNQSSDTRQHFNSDYAPNIVRELEEKKMFNINSLFSYLEPLGSNSSSSSSSSSSSISSSSISSSSSSSSSISSSSTNFKFSGLDEMNRTLHIPSLNNKFNKYTMFDEHKNTDQVQNISTKHFFKNYRNSNCSHLSINNNRINDDGTYREPVAEIRQTPFRNSQRSNASRSGYTVHRGASRRGFNENPTRNSNINYSGQSRDGGFPPVGTHRVFDVTNIINNEEGIEQLFQLMGLQEMPQENLTKPLKEEEFKKMTEGKYSDLIKSTETKDSNCSVCMSTFESNDIVKLTNCNHMFHVDCLNDWIENNHSCPICRGDLGDYEIRDKNIVIKESNLNRTNNESEQDDDDDFNDDMPDLE